MNRPRGHIAIVWAVFAIILLGSTVVVAQRAREIPPANVSTVAELSGLDEKTLTVILASPQQKNHVTDHLEQFVRRERPKLFTYRAIWAEMVERLENLRASAAENTFDPCEFVTDEAVEKAEAAVKEAAERFKQQCRMASDNIETFLSPDQCILVRNARANGGIPAPYCWLSLGENSKDQIQRLVSIYRARLELAQKYPHFKGKVSEEQLESQIAAVLSKQQTETLDTLRRRLQTAPPAPQRQAIDTESNRQTPGEPQ